MHRLSMILLLSALLACGEPPTTPGELPDEPLPALSLTPASGASGALIEVGGFDVSGLTGDLSVTVAGVRTSARRADNGRIVAAVPFFLDAAGAPVDPPMDPVDVTLVHDGTPVAGAAGAFRVDPLPEAPGAAEAATDALEDIVASLRTVSLSLEPTPGVGQAYALTTLDAVQELVSGDGEYSLATQLALMEGGSAADKQLVEGWLAASGVLDQLETVAGLTKQVSAAVRAIDELAAGTPPAPAQSPMTTSEIPDWDLAARMQLYVMVRDFGAQVLGATATTWGQTVGLAAGTVGLVVSVPFVGTVSAALGVASFAINNVALAYLPANVDTFELVLGRPYVFSGEPAETEIWIQASNSPPSITVLDLVDLVLTGMGFAASADRETARGIVTSVADFYLARVRSLMSAYGQAHPEADVGLDVASIPSMTWRAKVDDLRYVTPKSFTPDLIDANGLGVLAWRAAIGGSGEGRIYASINTGPDALSIPLIPGYEYNAGAFGESVLNTETKSVEVGPPLVVLASMADTISPGGTNGLEIRAGTTNAVGDTIWTSGMAVALTAVGGVASPMSGVTGTDGRFDALVTASEGSDSVRVDALVTAENGFRQEVSATALGASGVLDINASFPSGLAPGDTVNLSIEVERLLVNDSDYEPFAEVTVDVVGGTVFPASGATDDEGEWSARVTIDPLAESVSVTVTVTSLDGLQASVTVEAANLDLLPIRLISHTSRAWLNTSGTGGPNWRRYVDNFRNVLAPSTSVSWSHSSNGEAGGKTCAVTTSLEARSNLTFDPQTGLLAGWTSTSELSSVGTVSGFTAANNPSCGGNAQNQARLRFKVNEGNWRVTWDGEQLGEPNDAHPNWSSSSFFRDVEDNLVRSPPDALVVGEAVLGPGEYELWIEPRTSGNVNSLDTPGPYDATGGHELAVTFERLDVPPTH